MPVTTPAAATPPGRQKLLTTFDVARLCNVGINTVRRWWGRGRLPAPVRVCRRLLWEPADIEAFIAASKEAR